MKNLLLEVSSGIFLPEMAGANLGDTKVERSDYTEEDNIISPSVHGKTYSLALTPGKLFCCSKTGIKFRVSVPVTIQYELEYGSKYMRQIADSGYELVGPLFNIMAGGGAVTSVHLPHYLHLEDPGKVKSVIKYGHVKGGKVHLKDPSVIGPSYLVLENPSFSRAGPLIRLTSLWRWRKRSVNISGKVLLYFCVMNPHKEDYKEYRTHLYLVPCKRPELSILDQRKEDGGFTKIDKPPKAVLVAGNTYTVKADGSGAPTNVLHESLTFQTNINNDDLDFMEINVAGNATSISLQLFKSDLEEPVWTGQLTRADLEHQSERMLQNFRESVSDDSGKHFVMKHREQLIQRIRPIGPVLDALRGDTLTAEQISHVESKDVPEEKMRELYRFVRGRREQDALYGALRKIHPKIIKDLEAERKTQ